MLYAVVPVKTLARAKTRLAPALSFTQRLRLARRFLNDTLAITRDFPGAACTIVVSADPSVLALARIKGMIALPQTNRGGINRAVELGCAMARRCGATAVLILPTDLPYLAVDTLQSFTRRAPSPAIRLAADRHGSGTNALYLQPPLRDFARFGDDSLRRHRDAASALGRRVEIVYAPALAFDIDLPGDLARSIQR